MKQKRLTTPRKYTPASRVRFVRQRYHELVRHLGRDPSATEKILLQRICSLQWMLLRFDERIDEEGLGEVSGHAQRAYLAAENRLRLDLQALGLAPRSPEPEKSWWEVVQAAREANQPRESEPA